jgi:hypothetical protein
MPDKLPLLSLVIWVPIAAGVLLLAVDDARRRSERARSL